jgi:hypothetical protein
VEHVLWRNDAPYGFVYGNSQHASTEWIDEARADFMETLTIVQAAFGDNAFKRWMPEKESWRQQVLASLFDAQMFSARGLDATILRRRRRRIEAALKRLLVTMSFGGQLMLRRTHRGYSGAAFTR